jgi:hypothetical protein
VTIFKALGLTAPHRKRTIGVVATAAATRGHLSLPNYVAARTVAQE